jgi:peptidoglycan/LPS O-acetylase OafA/YrhL
MKPASLSGWIARPASAGGLVLPQLDALRGVAILAVFVQHLGDRFGPLWERGASLLGPLSPWIMTALHHAWWGVDLFFVISGFSLSLGYLRDRGDRPPQRAAAFLLRRAARILPAFFVALAVVIAVRPDVVLSPRFPAALAAHATLLHGYVSPGGVVLIGPAWSLTTESHFYLLMPLLAGPLLRRRRYALGLAIVLAAWVARGALHAAVLEPGARTGLFELTQRRAIVSRLDQFVLGMLAAAAYVDIQRAGLAARAAAVAPFVLALSFPALLASFWLEGALYLTPGGSWPYALISLATAAIVLAACACDARPAAWTSSLRALGIVSYGFFLYHELALDLVATLIPPAAGEPTWSRLAWTASLALATSVLAGLASWSLIERTALQWSQRGAQRAPAATFSTGS